MTIDRRHFCSTLAICSTGLIPQTASAQSEIRITGSIGSAVGADVGGIELLFRQVDADVRQKYTVPASGNIDLTVPETGTYEILLFNISSQNDNIPLVYSFGQENIDTDGNEFNFTIPEPYDTQIRFVDGDDNPVEGLRILIGVAGTYDTVTISKQGYVQLSGATDTEIPLAGPTDIGILSQTDGGIEPVDTVNVTESTEFEFVVENPEQYKPNYEIIEANPDAGFYYPYLLYRPNVSETFERPLYVEPLNSLAVANREELINQMTNRFNGPLFAGARQNGYPGIIPGFPRTPTDGPDTIQSLALPSYRSELLSENYQLEDIATEEFPADTLTRIDEQLLAMIEDAKSRLASEPYSVADRIHMSGFSSSANFSSRFAFLYPNEVRTLTIGGHTLIPLPKDSHEDISLPYPLGTADYEEFTGREFDMEAWADINQYIYVGEEDQPLPDTDSTGYYNSIRYEDKAESVFGMNRVTERLPFVKSRYMEFTDNATFDTFEGIGHRIDGRMEDATVDFHQQNSPTPNPDTTPEENESETNESTPGFGIGSGVTALGALGYMLNRRLTDDSER